MPTPRPLLNLLLLLTMLIPPSTHAAQPAPPPSARQLGDQIVQAFRDRNFRSAEQLLREQLELIPTDFVPHYNLACALAQLNQPEPALDSLGRAIELGFADPAQLRSDPHLAPVRNHPRFQSILTAWDRIVLAQADARQQTLPNIYGPDYLYTRDDALRLLYASALDPRATADAVAEVESINQWAIRHVFTELAGSNANNNTNAYTPASDAYVAVILPTPRDFLGWAITTYGPAARGNYFTIGGAYSHDHKQLVAQDIGATLRHEYFHVVHHRSATRLGQQHPVWIQEGLACLVEDLDPKDGKLVPAPSWRSNIAKRLERAGRLARIEDLAAIPRARFNERRPMANYAQARVFFMYLFDLGLIDDFYAGYIDTFQNDPTGMTAIRALFPEHDLRQINRDYRAWVRQLPEAPEGLNPGDASLGIEIETGAGDGPRLASFPRGQAREQGLRKGDVITAINNRPTRDQAELVRVLSAFQPGDTVTLTYRRGRDYAEAQLQLVPFEPPLLP
ncbi:MAG: PDZ domain-containing protein [Planctomycetota bacterium]